MTTAAPKTPTLIAGNIGPAVSEVGSPVGSTEPKSKSHARQAKDPEKTHVFGRLRRKFVGEIRLMIDADDARIAKRLRQVYGVDGATMMRMLLREKYTEVFGALPVTHDGEDDSE